MIRLRAYLISGALMLSGCNVSFQSSQFNFAKGFFAQDPPQPEKNWQVRWQGKTYPVFAVNHDGGTFFADEHGFMISFDGWQIRQVSISPSEDGKIVIKKTTADDGAISLDYLYGNPKQLAQDNCQVWERITNTEWEQLCKSTEIAAVTSTGYTNKIELNANGELVALRFVVLPGSAPMQISLKQQRRLVGSDLDRKS